MEKEKIMAKVIFVTTLVFVIYAGFFLGNSRNAQAIFEEPEVPVFRLKDVDALWGGWVIAYETNDMYGTSYGWSFSFSTSPSVSLQVRCMTASAYDLWIDGYSATTYLVRTSSSGSGSWRFKSSNYWAIAFYNSGYTDTTLTSNVNVIDLGAPPPPPTYNPGSSSGSFPWVFVIVPIVAVLCITGTVIGVVRRVRRKQEYTGIPTTTYSRPSVYGSTSYSYGTVQLNLLANQALEAFARGDFTSSISYWRQTLQINPNFYVGIVSLGLCYFALQDFDQAVYYLEKAFTMNPSDHQVLEFLARAKSLQDTSSRGLPYSSSVSVDSFAPAEDRPAKVVDETPLPSKSKVCVICGSELVEGSIFCTNCGASVE